jgi:vesicle coat complex subunit
MRLLLRVRTSKPRVNDRVLLLGSAAATTFINLVVKESDNNVKLIVLDRLDALRSKHGHVFDNLIMDVLQVLSRYFRVSTFSPFGNSHTAVPTSKYVERLRISP